MSDQDPIVIVSAARTPMAGMQGDFAAVQAPQLGAGAIEAALQRAGISGDDVDEVIMGNVLGAGQGQAPARQASKGAGIPDAVGATTINKMCGSGMKATMFGHDLLVAGSANVIVTGGMESMTNAPYLLPNARGGMRLGHGDVKDSMFLDGLEDAYDKGLPMGVFAEQTAQHYQFTREQQDAYAIESLTRAQKATADGSFAGEIAAFTVKERKGERVVEIDEQPGNANIDKIPSLRPAFAKDGTVTAANSSSISDGAAALVLMRQSEAEKRGLTPIAKIVGHATHAQEPAWFTTAPIGAVNTLFEKTGWDKADVDLFEINEAFAVVTMAAMKEMGLPHDIVNIHGGACALGHPIGASGARILVTLMAALQKTGGKKGVAALCIGGGEATAMAVELLH
ncbi:MAG: acetyl-CoA C-acyltransferase [Rhodospirillaceae bacterium]|jgi:acetyl-CoA C-acetyltransferase|nr:acetyl-CoA C-acyltransferase [Rhodospirillaceae bacterium]MBT4045795.1 acetyl-CoA C-acyltransferase [Rhodospirillaceae bacterium]MBT4688673.1 acetyl-CoA C-acyltransferase [Rhodospirillaceae bacterium]MBT5078977.1 acetyl-CoA C-acyltransferase [Rhodospirillaceae bacterium]MBT5523396.1 acetyl-CoA C-acyltransferase [Rhodospirillaceae bacterium]